MVHHLRGTYLLWISKRVRWDATHNCRAARARYCMYMYVQIKAHCVHVESGTKFSEASETLLKPPMFTDRCTQRAHVYCMTLTNTQWSLGMSIQDHRAVYGLTYSSSTLWCYVTSAQRTLKVCGLALVLWFQSSIISIVVACNEKSRI